MNTPKTSVQKRRLIISTAKSQLGETENPRNSNKTKFGKWYGLDGYAWCAMYVSWVYHKAGFPLGHINDAKGFRGCQSGYNHWKSTGELTKKPSTGDIVLFSWGGRIANHVGIFIEWIDTKKTKFKSIEGNTSLTNQRNGGEVMIRTRGMGNVKAFVKPKVLLGNSIPGIVDYYDVLQKGDQGADVAEVQKKLFDLGFKLSIDGDFGSATKKIVQVFQKSHKLKQTGIVSPSLKGLLDEELLKDKSIPDRQLTTGIFLQKGSIGASVVQLQKGLNKAGVKPKLTEDGDFGHQTDVNVRKFQKSVQITVDGVVGPQTWKHLLGE